MNIEDDVLSVHVRHTTGELLTSADNLKGLAESLSSFCDLSGHSSAEGLRHVAVGVKAVAIHALLTAATVAGLSERLSSVSVVLDSSAAAEDEPQP